MISTKQLAQYIENGLNSESENVFKIFADVGDFQNAYREDGTNDFIHYVNGILEARTPDILPIKNLQVATQSIQVNFVLDIELLNKDNTGHFVEVENLKSVLNSWAMANNGIQIVMLDDNGVNFEVTPQYDGITVGTVSQLSPIGEILPVFMDFSFIIISGGVNANSVEFRLNGETLLLQNLGVTRQRTSETNTFATEKVTNTIIQSNSIDFSVSMPFIDTEQNEKIENDILDGGMNKAQAVEYVRGNKSKSYIMVFGNNGMTLTPSKNIGFDFNLVEGKKDLLEYSDFWRIDKIITTSDNEEIEIDLPIIENLYSMIFWGDGKSEVVTSGIFKSHTYAKAGTYTIRVFNKSQKTYKLTFNADGGTVEPSEKNITYKQIIGALPIPQKDLKDFDYWTIDGTVIEENEISNFQEDKIAVAHYVMASGLYENEELTELTSRWTELLENGDIVVEDNEITQTTFENGGYLVIKKGITKIGNNAFENSTLDNVIFPTTINELGIEAFLGTTIKSLDTTNTQIEIIPESCFAQNDTIANVNLNNIKTIENSAFRECISLENLSFEQIERIEFEAFEDCTSLNTLTFPSTLTFIGEDAFFRSGLTTITFNGEIPPEMQNNPFDNTQLTTIYVPSASVEAYKEALPDLADKIIGQ